MLTGSLAAQWLSCAPLQDMGWIPGWETKISHATGYGQKFFLKYEHLYPETEKLEYQMSSAL